jgi:hypothetical protein
MTKRAYKIPSPKRVRKKGKPPILKSEWDDKRRNKFLDTLKRCGWDHLGQDHLGADLFQLGETRLAVDGHGLFVFLHDRASGCWKRGLRSVRQPD